jgi:hypothetical protein
MEISKLTVGQMLFAVSKQKMGNTTLNTTAVHPVVITSIAEDGKSFEASWNNNRAQKHYGVPPSWKAKKPYIVHSMNGWRARLATKEEKATGTHKESTHYIEVTPKEGA